MIPFSIKKVLIRHRETSFEISYFLRPGNKETIVFFHGLGSDKYDFLNAVYDKKFDNFTFFALDFPGSGNSSYEEVLSLGMADLAEISHKVISELQLQNLIVIGHSMGGLTGLLFADRNEDKVKGLINIEGNLASEDCAIFSRKTSDFTQSQFLEQNLMKSIQKEFAELPYAGAKIFADRFQRTVKPRAFHSYCVSIVEHSDNGQLLEIFKQLSVPGLFVHGDAHNSLSYLGELSAAGIEVAEIPNAHHWPHHDNPDCFYKTIHEFIIIQYSLT